MKENSIEHRKRAVIAALESSLGIVTTACQKVGVGRTQFYNWMKTDPEFAQQVKDIENIAFDFVESQLFRQIQENNVQATMFYLRTKGKNRGYSERHEITGIDGKSITFNFITADDDTDTEQLPTLPSPEEDTSGDTVYEG